MAIQKNKVSVKDFYLVGNGFGRGQHMVCHVRAIKSSGSKIATVICSEVKGNPGPSVTNCITQIMKDMTPALKEKGFFFGSKNYDGSSIGGIFLIEHYNDRLVYDDCDGSDRYTVYSPGKKSIGEHPWMDITNQLDEFLLDLSVPLDLFNIPHHRLNCPDHLKEIKTRKTDPICRIVVNNFDGEAFLEDLK